jgi:hypothetical protein
MESMLASVTDTPETSALKALVEMRASAEAAGEPVREQVRSLGSKRRIAAVAS